METITLSCTHYTRDDNVGFIFYFISCPCHFYLISPDTALTICITAEWTNEADNDRNRVLHRGSRIVYAFQSNVDVEYQSDEERYKRFMPFVMPPRSETESGTMERG